MRPGVRVGRPALAAGLTDAAFDPRQADAAASALMRCATSGSVGL